MERTVNMYRFTTRVIACNPSEEKSSNEIKPFGELPANARQRPHNAIYQRVSQAVEHLMGHMPLLIYYETDGKRTATFLTMFVHVTPTGTFCRTSASKERVSADLQLFQCLLNELLRPNEEVSVLKAFRLGKRSIDISEHSRPRPLKIVLANQEQVGLILSRRFRIKDTNRGVFFQPDYTPSERIKRRQLVLELRTRLQNGETDLVIYNDQIVRRPPLIRWTEPIRMRAQ
ncbi:hypothetical protein SprV_0702460200 [Sparganum proliferum]